MDMLKRGISLCLLVLISGGWATGEEKPGEKGQKIPIIKFIPGAFQLKSGKMVKGGLLLGAFAAGLTGAILENQGGNDSYRKYLDSTDVEEIVRLRRETESRFRKRNLYLCGMLAVWAVHLLDLKIGTGKKGGIKSEIGQDNINIGFYYSF